MVPLARRRAARSYEPARRAEGSTRGNPAASRVCQGRGGKAGRKTPTGFRSYEKVWENGIVFVDRSGLGWVVCGLTCLFFSRFGVDFANKRTRVGEPGVNWGKYELGCSGSDAYPNAWDGE